MPILPPASSRPTTAGPARSRLGPWRPWRPWRGRRTGATDRGLALAGAVMLAMLAACGDAGSEQDAEAGAPSAPPAGATTGSGAGATAESGAGTGAGTDAEGSGRDEAADGPLVVFLGDSLTAGFGLPGDQAFPAVLDRMFDATGDPIAVVNAGVSGDTSAGGARRLDWLMRQSPDVVVIGLGANDGLRGLDVSETAEHLRTIVRGVRAGGAEPVLLGMRIPTNYGPDYAEAFAAVYPTVARELDVPFVPLVLEGVGGVDEMNLADGIHPNPAGHRRMAENILPELVRALERAADES